MSRVRFADSVFEESADYGKKRRIERIAKEDNSESFAKDHIKKHTLDSDEEDDDREKYEKLDLKRVIFYSTKTLNYIIFRSKVKKTPLLNMMVKLN